MLQDLLQLLIALSMLLIVYFAYMKKGKLPVYAALVILASIALSESLSGLASLLGQVDFLDFIVRALNSIEGLVVYAELIALVYLLFFSKFKAKDDAFKITLIVYIVLTLIMALGIVA
ncbi:MAG: hypothetical protein ACOCU0_00440 [Bacillota bacterium]